MLRRETEYRTAEISDESLKVRARNILPALLTVIALSSCFAGKLKPAETDLNIWLLEGRDCGACKLYRSFDNGYPTQLTDYAGAGGPIPVSVMKKSAIPSEVLRQFTPHPYWEQSLSVMVLRDDKVLYVANISESSDVAHARFPEAIMAPTTAADWERASHATHYYEEHFKATWKLDYFVDVALSRRLPFPSIESSLLGEMGEVSGIARDNVILWGSASTPFNNSLYISERMRDVRESLEHAYGPFNSVSLYGNGDDPQADTSALIEDKFVRVQSSIDGALSSDGPSLGRLFHSLRGSHNNLLVQVGHSGPTGAPLWGQLVTIDAALMQRLIAETQSTVVMVSGACMGGQFATAPSCGFYAAHPAVVATGCQKTPEALRTSDDYLGRFFDGIRSRSADLDHDGSMSFAEAHWYASVLLEDHQIPYDSTDHHVDAFWQRSERLLPRKIAFADLLKLADEFGTDEERWAVRRFIARVPAGTEITAMDSLQINEAALQKVAKMTEATSAQRNAAMALPYPLVLTSLARRLIWRSAEIKSDAAVAVERCAHVSIEAFLRGEPPATHKLNLQR